MQSTPTLPPPADPTPCWPPVAVSPHNASLAPPKPLAPRRWSVRVTHEVVLPMCRMAQTGSSFNQPIQIHSRLQPWACLDSSSLGALDAPPAVPYGGVRVHTDTMGSHVTHWLEHTERRA